MTRIKSYQLWCLLSFLLSGCTTMCIVEYDISLHSVERFVDAEERYGEQEIMTIQEGDTWKYVFEDEIVKILWEPTVSRTHFILTNKTNHPIKIIWDEAILIDDEGISHKVTHTGVKFIDIYSSQAESIIPGKGSITDVIVSLDHIYYDIGSGLGKYTDRNWREEPIFPTIFEYTKDIEQRTKTLIGKIYQILLPFQIENVINEYIFTFAVEDVKVS